MTVGVIGLGAMGLPLARRLIDNGYDVVATSRSAATRSAAAEQGVAVLEDPRALAETLWDEQGRTGAAPPPAVLVSLPAGPEVRTACLGERGLLDGPVHGPLLVVDTSTCAPADARDLSAELSRHGCIAVDAPVSGGPTGAADGTLSVMAGGEQQALALADAVLGAIAARVVVCGGPGAGQVAKACNQLVVTANLAVVAEALVSASALGADPEAVREALLGGYASSRVLELHGKRMLSGDFGLGAAVRTQLKDIGIIRELTAQAVHTPTFDAAAELMAEAGERAGLELDHSAVVTVLEERAGHWLTQHRPTS